MPPSRATPLAFEPDTVTAMRAALPEVADQAVDEIVEAVPTYARAFGAETAMGRTIRGAVEVALDAFIMLVSRPLGQAATPKAPAVDGAFQLGRGEARAGRSVDMLLAAYRAGARVSWSRLSEVAVAQGESAVVVASFAGEVFAYIDELSAASVAGHASESDVLDRARRQHRERLAEGLVAGAARAELEQLVANAEWTPPARLTGVLVPPAQRRALLTLVSPDALSLAEHPQLSEWAVVLVPEAEGRGHSAAESSRRALLRAAEQRAALVGPVRDWDRVAGSVERAVRCVRLLERSGVAAGAAGHHDTEDHLASLIVDADPDARADLRARVLAPLAEATPASRRKLEQTLRAWLLHQGRRDDIAAALYVHPQTVRYRVGQLRDAFGDALEDPDFVLEATVALALPEVEAPGG